MRDKVMQRWSTYEPFLWLSETRKWLTSSLPIMLRCGMQTVLSLRVVMMTILRLGYGSVWKQDRVTPYYRNEQDVYLIDDDLVMVAEFSELEGEYDITGNPLHKMIVVTFLGRMSETIELRDLKSYYSWLRHSRRMTLVKNSRKHR